MHFDLITPMHNCISNKIKNSQIKINNRFDQQIFPYNTKISFQFTEITELSLNSTKRPVHTRHAHTSKSVKKFINYSTEQKLFGFPVICILHSEKQKLNF